MELLMKTFDAYLCGYYGMRNSGDDALMYAAAWGAKNFLNVQNLRISSQCKLRTPDFGLQEATLQATQAFRGQNRLSHYASALRSKRIIFGGGSVLHNAQDIKMKIDMMALSAKKGHMAVGVGLGPFKNQAAEKACVEFLNRCDFVGVRDLDSFAAARSIAPNANVHFTFDLAPLLLQRTDFTLKEIPRRGIAINLCPVGDMSGNSIQDTQRLNEMAYALKNIWQQTGEPIELIDINGHAHEGDFRLHQRLTQMLADTVPVTSVEYDANPLRLLQRLAGYKAIVSMRLHGAILGFLAGTPVLSLNYHSKCIGWCEQVGMPKMYRFDANHFSGHLLAEHVIAGLQTGFTPSALTPTQGSQLALSNWSKSYESSSQRLHSCYSTL
jgi:polysaccharide pyruvyl transferase WcaK-like protein